MQNNSAGELPVQVPASRRNPVWFYAAGLLVCCIPIIMRLAVVLNPPATDEGFYALHAMLNHASLSSGQGIYPLGVLQLYPILCSFVFAFDINHIVALRMIDICMAVIMAWQVWRLFIQESGNILYGTALSMLLIIAFNHPTFIQHGFRNSIFIALIFLIIALRIGLSSENSQFKFKWFLCGGSLALSVLFREAFALFVVVGIISILIAYGRRAALQFIAGGLLAAIFIIGGIILWRGSLISLIDAYKLFHHMAIRSGELRPFGVYMDMFKLALQSLEFLSPILVLIFIYLYIALSRGFSQRCRIYFWLLIILVPWYEILLKGALTYHYTISLIGIFGLCANLFKYINTKYSWGLNIFAMLICFIFVSPKLIEFNRMSISNVPHIHEMLFSSKWPNDMVKHSNYLLLAQSVKDIMRPSDSLAVTGHYHLLYVLTGLRPPEKSKNHFSDLGSMALAHDMDTSKLHQYIVDENPDIIVLSLYRPDTGDNLVGNALMLLPEYIPVKTITPIPGNDYGLLAGTVYVKKSRFQ